MRVSFPVALLTALVVGSAGCGKAKEGPSDQTKSIQGPSIVQNDPRKGKEGASHQGNPAGTRAGSVDLAYVPSDAVVAIIAHPRRAFASSAVTRAAVPQEMLAQMMPGRMEFDVRKVEEAINLFAPPTRDAQGRATDTGDTWIVRFSEKVDATELLKTAWRPLMAGKPRIDQATYEGKTYYRREYPRNELLGGDFPVHAAFLPDGQTVVFALESRLQKILSAKEEKGLLRERLRETDLDHDLIVALAPEPGESGKWAADGLAPVFADIAGELKYATLTADLDSPTPLEIVLEARDAQGAARVETLVNGVLEKFQAMLAATPQRAPQDQPALSTALELIGGQALKNVELTHNADRVALRLKRPPGTDDLVPKLIAQWVAQAEATARERADRLRQRNKLHELALAVHHFEFRHNHFPQPALRDKSGKPLLSWRVQILLELEQGDLYKEFRLDEPWDSEHNKKLIERIPEVFTPTSREDKGKTRFMLFVGPGAAFDGEKPLTADAIRDGTSRTIMIVEAGPDKAVPWTKPEDLPFDPNNPMAALGKVPDSGFPVAFFDGHVEWMEKNVSPVRLRQWIDPNDGQPIRDDDERGGARAVKTPDKTPDKSAVEVPERKGTKTPGR